MPHIIEVGSMYWLAQNYKDPIPVGVLAGQTSTSNQLARSLQTPRAHCSSQPGEERRRAQRLQGM